MYSVTFVFYIFNFFSLTVINTNKNKKQRYSNKNIIALTFYNDPFKNCASPLKKLQFSSVFSTKLNITSSVRKPN